MLKLHEECCLKRGSNQKTQLNFRFYLFAPKKTMIRLILIGLILNSCLSLKAQTSEIDSLETALGGLTSPSERVPLLLKLNELTPTQFPEKKYDFAHKALLLSKVLGNDKYLMEAYYRMGLFTGSVSKKNELAMTYVDSSMAIAQQLNDPLFIAHNLARRGHLTSNIVRTKETNKQSTALYTEALEIYKSIPNEKGIANALGSLSYYARRRNEIDEALDFAQQAIDVATKANDPKSLIFSKTQKGRCFITKGKFKDALKVLQEALDLAIENDFKTKQANLYNLLGVILNRIPDYDLAIDQINKGIELNKLLKDTIGLGSCLTSLGVSYSRKGSYDKSLEAYFLAVKYLESQDNISAASNAYTNIGKNYKQLKEYDRALEYYERAIKIKLKDNNEEGAGRVYNNMGTTCVELGEYDRALEYYFKSLELHKKTKYKNSEGIALINIGEVYMKTQSFAKALDYSYRALDIFTTIDNKSTMSAALQIIAETYMEMKKYPEQASTFQLQNKSAFEIENMLLRAKDLAEASNRFTELRNVYITLVEFYRDKDSKNALTYQDKLMAINDSIYQSDKLMAVAEMQTKFDLTNKVKENLHLKETNELIQSRNKLYLLTAISLFGFLIAGGIFYRQLNNVKEKLEIQNNTIEDQNDQLTSLNKTKDRFFGIIAHDLKSPLIAMQGLGKRINFLLKKDDQEQLLALGDQVDNTSTKLNDLLDNLLNWASIQTGDIPFHPQTLNLFDIGEDVVSIFENNAAAKGVNLEMDIADDLRIFADERATNTILRNLISNAVKFTPKGGTVSLSATQKNGNLNIAIKDTGEGISPSRLKNLFTLDKKSTLGTSGEKGTGLGLMLCKELVEMNGGTLNVCSTEGVGSSFEFALPTKKTS